jgi:HPr kinase/phosphorylase
MFSYPMPCCIFTYNLTPGNWFSEIAEAAGCPVLQTDLPSSEFSARILRILTDIFAPRQSIHGVLVEVYGAGILILGDSGVGKSETALEMIKRGHRFVADDAVEIKRVSNETLVGSCPKNIQYFLELRGIGIIDVRRMYGVESVRATQSIDLIIKLEMWDDSREYDRIGLTYEHMEILGNQITCHSVPIRPGRNLAIICEAAALNHRQRKMGYNAAEALTERIMYDIIDKKG